MFEKSLRMTGDQTPNYGLSAVCMLALQLAALVFNLETMPKALSREFARRITG